MRSVDVVVVGAGIAGASVAYALARAGCKVALLDRQRPGSEASGGFSGLLTTVADGHATGPYAVLSRRALATTLEIVPELEERSSISIELTRTPVVRLAHLDAYSRRATDRWVSARVLRSVCPALAPNINGGILTPVEHHLDPRRFLDATIRAATNAGATIDLTNNVTSLVERHGRVTGVRNDRGEEWSAANVVLANGAWAPRLLEPLGIDLPLRPVRGQLVVLEGATPATLPFIVASGRGYLVPKKGGRIVVGATHEEAGFEKNATLAGMLHLSRVAAALPSLLNLRIAETFVGLRPTGPDGMPFLGSPDREGLTLALGYAQHGVLLSSLCASLLADLIAGTRIDPILSSFSATRALAQKERAA